MFPQNFIIFLHQLQGTILDIPQSKTCIDLWLEQINEYLHLDSMQQKSGKQFHWKLNKK